MFPLSLQKFWYSSLQNLLLDPAAAGHIALGHLTVQRTVQHTVYAHGVHHAVQPVQPLHELPALPCPCISLLSVCTFFCLALPSFEGSPIIQQSKQHA